MKAQLIDGKRISAEIKAEAAEEAAALKAKGITPCLAVVLVGDDSASQVYVNNKKKAWQSGFARFPMCCLGGQRRRHFWS